MNKKLLMLLAAGALVVTGCAAKEATNSNSKENSNEKNTTAESTTGKTQSTTSESSSNEKKESKHDLVAAKKLIDVVAISGDDLSRLKEQTNMLAWLTQDRATKSKAPNGEELFTISKEDYLDVINEFSAKTYNMSEALNLLKGENFNEYEVSSTKSPLIPTESEIHYYKGDDKIVFVGIDLGNNYPQEVESEDKWKISDDSIEINVVDKMTKEKISTVVLKLNDKNYSGGNKKSTYYVAKVIAF